MRGLLLAQLYQGRRTPCFLVNGAPFWTRTDIARIFNSFFFERQQCFIWGPDTNWGFVREVPYSPLSGAQLPIWDTTCAAKITMAPSDRQDKKPKDASPWLWTAPRISVSLSIDTVLHPLPHRCSLTCTPLTSCDTRPGLLSPRCVVYCIMQWWSHRTAPRHGGKNCQGKDPGHTRGYILLLRTSKKKKDT